MRILKSFRVFVSLISTLAVLAIPVSIAGCSGGCKTKPSTVVYRTSGVTHVTYAAGLRGWNEYIGEEYKAIDALPATDPSKDKRKDALLAKEKQLKAATEKYQEAQITSLKAAKELAKLSETPNDPNLPGAQDKMDSAVAKASIALNAAADLLVQFGMIK